MMRKSPKFNNLQEQENISEGNNIKNTEFKMPNNSKKKNFFTTLDYVFLITSLLVLVIYIFSFFEPIAWQMSSIGRIFLIKILPFYDWRSLKNNRCFVNRFLSARELTADTLNCNMCEDIVEIEVYRHLEEEILEERYIKMDKPIILTEGLESWPNDSKFIEEIRKEERFYKSYPCNLATNIFKGIADIDTILLKQKYFDQFFIHFQNCEIEAMRTFRKYVFRPDVLPSAYSPTLYNWLIWNQYYNSTNYKPIELVEKVTVVGQLFGSTYFRLIPRKNCENVCSLIDVILQKGEILIFTSLWDLEYRPNASGENMAAVMEY